jgi:hypothetical protein
MTDITDEQRAAAQWLRRIMNIQLERHAGILFDLLPSELTNPQPALPTEPGLYVGPDGVRGHVWRVEGRSLGAFSEAERDEATPADGPFTRLVPERPQITREQVTEALYEADVSGFVGGEYIDTVHQSLLSQAADRD